MSARWLELRDGTRLETPLTMPVYQPKGSLVPMAAWVPDHGVRALILNAFFLYKDRAVRARFEAGMRLKDHIGFHGCVMTDSGAFQGLKRPLHLDNRTIVAFQDAIGADIISPLDLITPPWDGRAQAEAKLEATLKRIRQAMPLARNATLAGVQQGGRFRDLRQRATDALMEMGAKYLAIGSLVPFFNQGHDLRFVREVVGDARRQAGPDVPIHVYGAGDPVELPFMAAMGADIFDSSAWGHYARGGWYMTPFGALNELGPLASGPWRCGCAGCADGADAVVADTMRLAAHNLHVVTTTVAAIRAAIGEGTLDVMLATVLEVHRTWFPASALRWED
jgi:7-cyano-7-deazaguanine tRNA-ribosyltransferase